MKLGAIFDWDGVVLDSSSLHEASWERLAAESGLILPPDHFKKGFGMKNQVIIPNLLGWTDDPEKIDQFSLRKEELYRELVVERGVTALPGVSEWLDALHQREVPCGIGSSTHRLNIETILDVLNFRSFFPVIVTAEDVSHGKPDPEVFLTAADRLGCLPAECVVFEDAFVGIEAARRGGMKVVGVATTNPIETLKVADLAVHRLDELTVDQLIALIG